MSRRLPKGHCYVVARNAGDRPALQHIVAQVGDDLTLCGVLMSTWSRFYMSTKLSVLLCKRCRRITQIED